MLLDIKLLWRDWRGGQLGLIVWSLVLAVAVVTAVSLLADRVERGLNEQISAFLAADMAVRSGIEIAPLYKSQADDAGLQTANTATFVSMLFSSNPDSEANHLAAIKAVESTYPLRGELELVDSFEDTTIELSQSGPPVGEVWVEPRLLTILDIKVGDTLEVGYAEFTISKLIANEPDRGGGFSSAAARVIMNYADLAKTELIRPGSRVNYRLLLAGDTAAVDQYKTWFAELDSGDSQLQSHVRLQTAEEEEEQLGSALQRGRSFLLLSGTIGVLLAGLAMALASHRYANRLIDQVALMKAWGQSARRIRQSQFVRLSVLTLIATTLGLFFGWLAHWFLLEVAKEFFGADLPLPSMRPWLVSGATGIVCVLGFALPALWHLPAIEPLRVLRRDLPDSLMSQGMRLSIGVVALLLLTFWYSGSLLIAALFLGCLFALFAVSGLFALQFLRLVQTMGNWRGSYVRLGLANLWRRRGQTMVQLIGFSTTLLLLLVVTGLRTSLISEWQAQLPEDTPTHFVFNVADQDLEQVKSTLDENGVLHNTWYPMVRGRIVGINGEALTRERLAQSDGLAREINFTQTAELPVENVLTAGTWWGEDFDPAISQISMEQDVAQEIGVGLGDNLQISVGGIEFSAQLTSIRTVNWQSMTPNFYLIFTPGSLDKFSPNWLSGVLDPVVKAQESQAPNDSTTVVQKEAAFVTSMVKQFPTAVVLQLGDIIERIRSVIDKVTRGLEMILLLVLACGALVLFAAIAVSFDERLRENAILRTLGSSQKLVFGALAVEFATLGLIAGLIASVGAEIVLYFMQTRVFEMEPGLHPSLWLLGMGSGVLLIGALGLLRSRPIISVPPLQSLRQLN